MRFANSKLVFIVILPALVDSCTVLPQNYAPVTTNTPDIAKDNTKYHQVKKGDTLYAISLIYDINYQQLAQWNRIATPYTIEIDQKIRLSDPNLGNKPMHNHIDEEAQSKIKQIIVAATAANRISPQKKTVISLNNKPNLTDNPPYKSQPFNNITEKNGSSPQKKSIISIDNAAMLKLNFQWPIKGKILKYFSPAHNKGIDIAGKTGQDVSAAEAGKVVYSGQGLIGYGNLLIIKHNNLYLSAYANNSQLLVTEGHTVDKGEVIAKAGQAQSNSAKSNQASLHFEIRKNGKPVNPLNFLPGK
ncbi:MAG: peptidoglycan DD-metalloendopeptidase family protein [Methylobacter sp.]|uniref:Peptidoglycan DD-metalloendopeptidase family protein n=1 Tax=Candidatus Methylobacter titanis TaxID=3053457 RepID=A0AA43Q431_9GAMM|nr:peptidoglycan DD-metalloendopeptidase family protein [Candidatus Methylobacter titanis]